MAVVAVEASRGDIPGVLMQRVAYLGLPESVHSSIRLSRTTSFEMNDHG